MKTVRSFLSLALAVFLGFHAFPGTCLASPPTKQADTEQGITQWLSFKESKSLADKYLREGKTELAIPQYKKALDFLPHSTALHFNLAIAHYLQGDLYSAVHCLERVVQLDPYDVEARYNLACLKFYLNDSKAAREHFELARNCCGERSSFTPLIKQGLEFLDRFQTLDPSAQDLVLHLIATALTF